ncbi:mariner Mos1 transposase [Trichonephila clavipes]|nr:mariner Mos1 transposase [Trichonephila clavipes]
MSNFMPSDHDLRTSLIFCYHLKKNAAESHQTLVEAYDGNALSRAQCYRWFEKFQNGDFDLLKPGETVNTDPYKQELFNLNDAILEKREQCKKRQHKVIFLDDNAPNHRAKPSKDIVKALDWEPLAHAAYSPDLAPSDYHLFASLGHALADQRFTSYENVKFWPDDWLASKDRSFFWCGIYKLPKRWGKCEASDGYYFK